MMTVNTYIWFVAPIIMLALALGALMWSNASTRRFDRKAKENRK